MVDYTGSTTFLMLAAPFIAAAFAPFLHKYLGYKAGWVLALFPAAIFIHFCGFISPIAAQQTFIFSRPWVPFLGVDLSFYIDGLSLIFILLISGIGTLIIIYAGGYLKGHHHQGRFFSFLFLFMGSMLGVVSADNFITLFVFWELTSITSFLLIGFNHLRAASRRAAIQALVVTGMGGLSLLAGLVLIIIVSDFSSMSEAIAGGSTIRDNPYYVPIFLLILGGAFTKSAQWPFHFWLPNAMEAPTPVSAYLHSATMVKAGVYLLMRVHPFMGNTDWWMIVLPFFGGLTLLSGTLLALRQTDLKLILAYTTVASLGLLVMLTGTSLEAAISGATLYLFAHSLFKGCLFMVAGTIDHETGTRDITKLGGLCKLMPITFGAAFIAAWSMGGLPLSIGFMAKEVMYDALVNGNGLAIILLIVAIAGNAMMFAAGFAVALYPFIGKTVQTPKSAHEGPVMLWLGPVLLAAFGIIAIIGGSFTGDMLLNPMASSIINHDAHLHVSPAIHFNMAFMLSLLTVAIGGIIWWQLGSIREIIARILHAIDWGPDKGFDQVIQGLIHIAYRATRFLQTGRLEYYLTMTFILVGLALLLPMIIYDELPHWPEWPSVTITEVAVFCMAIIGLYAVLVANNRLTAIVSLGIQGFAVALIFLLFGAPDLAFTQFMVETLSVVILALVLTRLSLLKRDHRSIRQRIQDGAIALTCGFGFGALLLRVTQGTFDASLSDFFAQYSYQAAHGRNIVNVILVDFRGLDTLGEITVVLIAGLSVLALIRVRAKTERLSDREEEERTGQPDIVESEGGKQT